MTVSSLWTVLDEAGCGKAVGAKEMVEYDKKQSQRVNPWNYNEANSSLVQNENRMSLAIDLSIWICEALTSTALSENHANPALHLVFTRTTRLLSMGIKLIVVIEGKRRVRGTSGERDSFRKRRSGTAFWGACQSCEEMLRILGVPVVRAKAEGEALCALLNQRGIVDGVISNDGDCLLFGAKVVYTHFSLDNLDKSIVIRYDVSELRGCLQDDREGMDGGDDSVISLERGDLISFALLTGSDLAGDGLPKVGHKKAIRFIKQCKLDYPLTQSTACIDELKSWARTAKASAGKQAEAAAEEKKAERCCSLCCHPGDKRGHQKHGCELCGTMPGEPCFASSTGDKFRNSLRLKALAMVPKFDPTFVVESYMNPNDNQVPIMLLGETARSLRMSAPSLGDMMNFPNIIKGHSLVSSKEYVKQSVARLLARSELVNHNKRLKSNGRLRTRLSREKPVPLEITRKLVHNKVSCYEITWSVNATTTDGDGHEIDGYEFSTIESQALVEKRHPNLVETFLEHEKEEAKQGDAEANRRRDFVSKLLDSNGLAAAEAVKPGKKKGRRNVKRRSEFFGRELATRQRDVTTSARPPNVAAGDDVHKLLAVVNDSFQVKKDRVVDVRSDNSTVSELTLVEEDFKNVQEGNQRMASHRPALESNERTMKMNMIQLTDQTPTQPSQHFVPCWQHAAVTHDGSFSRETHDSPLHKRNLFDETPEPSVSVKRLRWSIFEAVADPLDVLVANRGHLAADHVWQMPVFIPGSYPVSTLGHYNEEEMLHWEQMPVLTPGRRHSMVCDMGIQVEITPLISSKYM